MTLDLYKRSEKGTNLSAAEHDANFLAIETEVNGKTDTGHAHTLFDVDGLVTHLNNLGDVASNANIRDVVGAMIVEAGGTYDSVTKTITLP